MLKDIIAETVFCDLVSLKNLAAMRVAISICEAEDTQLMIGRFKKIPGAGPAGFLETQWKSIRGKANRKLMCIGVPPSLQKVILDHVWPTSYEVFKWILYHFWDTGIDTPTGHYWTSRGAIDYEKTAELVVQNESLDVTKRFKLACVYCMETQIRSVWDEMNLLEQRTFYLRGNLEKKSDHNPLVLFWTYYIQEVPTDHWQSKAMNETRMFKFAAEKGYLTATKYFIHKLRARSKHISIDSSLRDILRKIETPKHISKDHLAIAQYLLTKMKSSNQAGFCRYIYCPLLCYFLEWPLQKYFIAIASKMIEHFATLGGYVELLERIFHKEMCDFKDYDYKRLFMEFWLASPERFRWKVNTDSDIGYFIFLRFINKRFGFILEELRYKIKAKFRATLFRAEISEHDNYFVKEDVEFFKFLVRERVVTKPSVLKYSNYFIYLSRHNKLLKAVPYNYPKGELLCVMDCIIAGM